MRFGISVAAVSGLCFALPAMAQTYGVDYGLANRQSIAIYNNYQSQSIDSQYFHDGWQNSGSAARSGRGPNPGQVALAACRKAPGGCTSRFVPLRGASPGPDFLAGNVAKTPGERAEMKARSATFLSSWYRLADLFALARNDVADPAAYSFLTAMQIYANQPPEISPALLTATRAQAHALYANSTWMAQMGNLQRHQQYEALGIVGVYLNSEYLDAREVGDQQRIAKVRTLARDIVRNISGVEPEQLKITPSGIVESGVKGTGRGGPVAATIGTTRFARTVPIKPAIRQFDGLLSQRGGDPSDLAWGAAGSFAVFYLIANNQELTRQQLAGTARTARDLLLQSSDTRLASDAGRTQAYDQLAGYAMTLYSQYADAARTRGDPSWAPLHSSLRISAREAMESMVKPATLSQFEMTPDGLVKRR